MLRFVILGVVLLCFANANNLKDVAPSEQTTKLEKMQGLKGSILNKGYSDVGSVYGNYGGDITVTAFEFDNIKSNSS